MKRPFQVVVACPVVAALVLCMATAAQAAGPLIINHEDCVITAVPQADIQRAKDNLHIAYGHTSHGSQLTTGMTPMDAFMQTRYGTPAGLYTWTDGGTGDTLDIDDSPFSGASDLGNPNYTAWEPATRTYLASHPNCNVIIWSWCGQVSSATQANIATYLSLMTGLENDFPNVKFVYMTGHLDGSGATGNLNVRNQQIRDYCTANNKILYDFADIESYDPDGLTHYMPLLCNDNCDYDSDGNGTRDRNWATVWQNAHPGEWYSCSAAHTQPLNGNRKAYAAWALWAALARADEVTITKWELLAAHGAAGTLGAEISDNGVEARGQGITQLRLTFDNPLNPATVNSGSVIVTGQTTSGCTLESGNRVLVATLAAALPNAARYTASLSASVRGEGDTDVVGDTSLVFGVLAGDVDGNETVSALDIVAIRAKAGQALDGSTVRYDVDCSGAITSDDMRSLRSQLGQALP
ncbi:MAG: hypothetical protein JXL80_15230 [Planctomycetes bacterium]|nr:hypothetical protein [Planctomycetota bacterium]